MRYCVCHREEIEPNSKQYVYHPLVVSDNLSVCMRYVKVNHPKLPYDALFVFEMPFLPLRCVARDGDVVVE